MAATPANYFGAIMTLLTGNAGGAVEQLPAVNVAGGKTRYFVETVALASQASGKVIAVAEIPLYAAFLGIEVVTDTSLGSSTIAFGNAGNGNSAIYGAAATVTSTNAIAFFNPQATYGKSITTGYDCQSGLAVTSYAPGARGGLYEHVVMTIGAAALPASGNLTIVTYYGID